MAEHPIQGLMQTAMENIKEMVDVNTIVGDPVQTPDGSIIMPISRVGFGFVAGGSDIRFGGGTDTNASIEGETAIVSLPFGGGSGGGVSITPIAFLHVNDQGVNIVSLDNSTHLWEKIMDSAPKVVEKIQSMMGGSSSSGMGSMMPPSGGMMPPPSGGMTPPPSGGMTPPSSGGSSTMPPQGGSGMSMSGSSISSGMPSQSGSTQQSGSSSGSMMSGLTNAIGTALESAGSALTSSSTSATSGSTSQSAGSSSSAASSTKTSDSLSDLASAISDDECDTTLS